MILGYLLVDLSVLIERQWLDFPFLLISKADLRVVHVISEFSLYRNQ